jgi:hypothetical protein
MNSLPIDEMELVEELDNVIEEKITQLFHKGVSKDLIVANFFTHAWICALAIHDGEQLSHNDIVEIEREAYALASEVAKEQ